MPEIIHHQKGLDIHINDKNKVCVVRLHYTADPLKRSPEWFEEATAGMSNAQIRREYEIDFNALIGERVFPMLASHKEKIVLKPPYPPFDEYHRYWGGLDYGTRNPTAFIVFAEGKNPDGENALYAIWEHYEPTKNLGDLCDTILECEYNKYISWIAADRAIWQRNQQAGDKIIGLTSIADLMIEKGVSNIVRGVPEEESFISYVHSLWSELDDGRHPRFYILDRCPNLVREMENIVYAAMTPAAIKTQSLKEQMVNKDNHAIDATKYFFNSYPGLKSARMVARDKKLNGELGHKHKLWLRHIK